ncbi:hypothetical protein LX16_5186 [Stackebrandtia albiflava]|uniref:Uncharacterized protein n=1 Tax=Stackebrandtia albiflava TaxID=406432 RepID=A0A562ULG3_9ACTN|nr:hypothetical protein [Stackebrandtia albiflava]TWJ06450.1 hypothetical protein LX16_5186 [Stackebrandtia albiflava]
MASLDEFISSVRGNVSAVNEVTAAFASSGSVADELVATFQGLAAHGLVDGSLLLKRQVEEAQELLGPVVAKLEEAIATAEGLKGLLDDAAGAVARPAPTPMTRAPAAVREPVAKVGDPVTAPPAALPDPHRQELAGHDEEDKSKSRFRRAGRAAIRHAETMQKHSKEATKVVVSDRRIFDPPASGTYTTVGVPEPPPTSITADKIDPTDIVGNAAVMTAFAFEAFARRFRRKKK